MKVSSSQIKTSNRFERRKQRTREDLLVAATRVLAAKGLHRTKIADIAAAADIGVGTFYLHFDTKEALFDAVVEDAVTRLKTAVDDARRGIDDPVEETCRRISRSLTAEEWKSYLNAEPPMAVCSGVAERTLLEQAATAASEGRFVSEGP